MLNEISQKVKAFIKALKGAKEMVTIGVSFVLTLIPNVLPDAIIPLQLDSFRILSSAIGIVTFIIVLFFSPLSQSGIKATAYTAIISIVGSLILSIAFVETIPVGADEKRPVLVGFHITEKGRAEIERAELRLNQESRYEIVSILGYDRIPFIWGWSYSVVRWSMAVCFFGLIGSTTAGMIVFGKAK